MVSYIQVQKNYNPRIIISKWGRFSDKLFAKLRKAVGHHLSYYGLQAIRRYFPKGGKQMLENALKVTDESSGYRIMFSIGTGNPELDVIVKVLEYGSPPHTISARQSDYLRFVSEPLRFYWGTQATIPMKIMGDVVYRKRVQHPGNRAYRMIQRGLNDIRFELFDLVKKTINEEIRDMVRER